MVTTIHLHPNTQHTHLLSTLPQVSPNYSTSAVPVIRSPRGGPVTVKTWEPHTITGPQCPGPSLPRDRRLTTDSLIPRGEGKASWVLRILAPSRSPAPALRELFVFLFHQKEAHICNPAHFPASARSRIHKPLHLEVPCYLALLVETLCLSTRSPLTEAQGSLQSVLLSLGLLVRLPWGKALQTPEAFW